MEEEKVEKEAEEEGRPAIEGGDGGGNLAAPGPDGAALHAPPPLVAGPNCFTRRSLQPSPYMNTQRMDAESDPHRLPLLQTPRDPDGQTLRYPNS